MCFHSPLTFFFRSRGFSIGFDYCTCCFMKDLDKELLQIQIQVLKRIPINDKIGGRCTFDETKGLLKTKNYSNVITRLVFSQRWHFMFSLLFFWYMLRTDVIIALYTKFGSPCHRQKNPPQLNPQRSCFSHHGECSMSSPNVTPTRHPQLRIPAKISYLFLIKPQKLFRFLLLAPIQTPSAIFPNYLTQREGN